MNKLKRESTPSFMTNVAIILFAQIMVKILGMVYRIVITNIENFGDAGNGFYNAGFQVYTVLLAISSVGIPNAIAKMVSERTALGDYKGAHTIFKTAFMLFGVIGAVCTAILYFGSEFIAFNIIGMDGTQYVMRALAPSIFFVCISSVIRGYFQGLNNMHATSNSQMFEQVFKCLLTIVLVVLTVDGMPQIMSFFSKIALLYNDDVTKSAPELMAAWANAATSLATFISFVYLAVFYIKRKSGIMEQVRKTAVESLKNSTGSIIKSILMLSIPISLASIITAINRVIDLATITHGIEIAFAGRSNVGKSTLINKLFNRKNLARVSSVPGKTATINFYKLENIFFADLPGYGYAKVSRSEKDRWSDLIEGYLNSDRDFYLIFLLIDMRHAPSADDLQMINYLIETERPFVIVLTKADKLKKTEREKRMEAFKTEKSI